uniref:Transmembrane protein n=1 Tax=Echinococcus granulosus TaxID=6210 RepID=A0A068WRS4_ECHGR|nr:hypothetical protein EgrG_000157600 [Echinococcus granulosus]
MSTEHELVDVHRVKWSCGGKWMGEWLCECVGMEWKLLYMGTCAISLEYFAMVTYLLSCKVKWSQVCRCEEGIVCGGEKRRVGEEMRKKWWEEVDVVDDNNNNNNNNNDDDDDDGERLWRSWQQQDGGSAHLMLLSIGLIIGVAISGSEEAHQQWLILSPISQSVSTFQVKFIPSSTPRIVVVVVVSPLTSKRFFRTPISSHCKLDLST